ncbi:MAG: MoaD/ThiS family protein [Candidatus Izemoplasma sp.]
MVKVIFLNLLRSKYNIKEIEVKAGSIHDILAQIQEIHPEVELADFRNTVIFINTVRVIHESKYSEPVNDGDEIVFTHFIGGG